VKTRAKGRPVLKFTKSGNNQRGSYKTYTTQDINTAIELVNT